MAIEIERKFLVLNNSWQTSDIKGVNIKQGYIKNSIDSVVRIRLTDEKGFVTIKGNLIKEPKKKENMINNAAAGCSLEINDNNSLCRLEFEYEIPPQDALEMLGLCEKPLVEKIRYNINFMGYDWSIDYFEGDNYGLIVAEIELKTEHEIFEKPPWLGKEVTCDSRYLNSNLIKKPFKNW
ncbi:MAG: CYTH domain-containing protein [Desulfamplus sp.]|nr:CYTH domain-containing protein [Desulfamplus sp.]